MALIIGTQLGSYEITALLGKGGMGEVYRARDLKLKREVAIKILPEEFSGEADRVGRFQREAEVLASLNHPNIAAIYDFQHADDTRFIVLELVEGETLADRVAASPIPIEDTLHIAKQICEALEAAHERGVIHRDLKPANVKITADGKVKVLDFGLAKALEAAPMQMTSNSATALSLAATNAGMILGTAGYMSPEQARGHEADPRSDIFSLGCLLYEMLTGRQTFPGETATDVIASVIAREADFSLLPSNVHPKVKEVILRCLAKNRKERWHAVADIRFELESIRKDPHGIQLLDARHVERQPLWRRIIPVGVTALVLVLVGVAATLAILGSRPETLSVVTRFPVLLPEGQHFSNMGRPVLAISPDGTNLVYIADRQFYLRTMGNVNPRPIQGVDQNAQTPFFSPDGRWLGFWSRDNKIKKVAITGGAAVTICDTDDPLGASWGADDEIYIGQGAKGIARVSANGGKLETVVAVKPNELAHGPQLLPGGDHILFTLASEAGADRWDKAQIVIQSLKTGERKTIVQGGSDARYVPTGYIVYALNSTVLGVPFDLKKLVVSAGPVPVVENVQRSSSGNTGAAHFVFSSNGSLVYISGELRAGNSLALLDRFGSQKPRILDIPPGPYFPPRISPDGRQLAFYSSDGGNGAIWIYDLKGGSPMRRLTFEGNNSRPMWTLDGQNIIFMSARESQSGLYKQRADGSSPPELLVIAEPGQGFQPEAITRNGEIVMSTGGSGTRRSLLLLMPGDKKPRPMIANGSNSSLSPDGKWLAYGSNESGQWQGFVQSFPPSGTKYQLPTDGNGSPLWSPDGKQLFYPRDQSLSSPLLAVDIRTQPKFIFGKTTTLSFEAMVTNVNGPRPYDITPDGKYFVALLPASKSESGKSTPDQVNVTLNWFSELQQHVPVK
jgi:serine/threonine-protein kinase